MMLAGSILAGIVLFGWRLLFDRSARHLVRRRACAFPRHVADGSTDRGPFRIAPGIGPDCHGLSRKRNFGRVRADYQTRDHGGSGRLLDQSVPDTIVIGNRSDIQPWWADEFLALRFGGVGVQEAGTLYERIFARKCITEIWPSKAIFGAASEPASIDVTLQSIYSWIVACAVALITLPLTLTIAALIKATSRGPVLTRETRVGLHNVTFEAYRFRCAGPDGTYTRVGEFLRRHGLVWLPQLLNVLKGQMAMVGPRPERPHFARRMNELIPVYRQRYRVKPGVTGWARIHRRRGDAQDSLRDLEYDLYYLENISPLVDFFILLLSLKTVEASDSA